MITATEYTGQPVGVFGLGKAGQATVAALQAGGAQVFAWDDKGNGTQHFNDWPWDDLKALVLSPGVPLTHPKPHAVAEMAKKHGVPVIGDIELLYRACPQARYIGITGTNGKSTTTTLIGHILKAVGLRVEIGGNLGTPALALEPLGKESTYVLELSSYQLDLVQTTRFHVAVLLNITPDHLDRHGSMEGYIAAKLHIFDRQCRDDVAIIAVDDAHTRAMASRLKDEEMRQIVAVSTQEKLPNGIYAQDGWLHDQDRRFDLNVFPALTGRHNWQNACVAYAVARACGVEPDTIYEAMKTFPGLRHRLQAVATINGVRFINDSKATNAEATANALAPYENIYWILGGKPKAGGIAALEPYFPRIAHAFLIGEAAEEFARTLDGKVAYMQCGTLDVAVKRAAAMAFAAAPSPTLPLEGGGGAVLLLSPACASFDQFRSFEERGDVFCELILNMGQNRYELP